MCGWPDASLQSFQTVQCASYDTKSLCWPENIHRCYQVRSTTGSEYAGRNKVGWASEENRTHRIWVYSICENLIGNRLCCSCWEAVKGWQVFQHELVLWFSWSMAWAVSYETLKLIWTACQTCFRRISHQLLWAVERYYVGKESIRQAKTYLQYWRETHQCWTYISENGSWTRMPATSYHGGEVKNCPNSPFLCFPWPENAARVVGW